MQIMLETACGCRRVVSIQNHAPRYIIPILGPTKAIAHKKDEEVPRWWYDHSVPMPKDMFRQREFIHDGIDSSTGLPLYREEMD